MAEKEYIVNNPTLMAEWHWEKNNELGFNPQKVTAGNNNKVWWKCAKGHEWQMAIYDKVRGRGCPYCANRSVLKGYNDLATCNPVLAAEWDYEKNKGLTPNDVLPKSGKKVWWKCGKGHEWKAQISERSYGTGCPYCANKKVLRGYNDLATLNPILTKEWNYEKNGDVKPEKFTAGSMKKVWWKCSKGHEWQAQISNRNKGAGCPYCINQAILQGFNDLATLNPFLAQEWNYEKNGDLKPEQFTTGSNKKVWWKCQKKHEWQATIASRSSGCGCPICISERRTSFPEYAIIYYLQQCGEEIIHLYKGNGYELDIYVPSKKVAIEYDGNFWHKNRIKKDLEKNLKCKNDGIKLYRLREGLPVLNDSSIDYIVDKNQKDLDKVLQKVLSEIVGFTIDIDLKRDDIAIENLREYTEKVNSLLYTNPELAKEWNYEKNSKLKPEHVSVGSEKKVWWKCQNGHEWQAVIASRNNGCGCPFCSGYKAWAGFNDLLTLNFSLAQEWNYCLNKNLKPEQFTASSGKKVWWKCNKGHEWAVTIHSRSKGSGCPYCANQKTLQGYNDLVTANIILAKEWDYVLNENLKPEQFTANSHKKAWWKCSKGHNWRTTIKDRNQGNGCPYCAGKKVLQGYNDLSTFNLKLAKEWDYTLNENLRPEQFTANSHKKVWWKCGKGHNWQATIKDRNQGNGCPYCANKIILQGYNDLATLNPDLAKEWNYDLNVGVSPKSVSFKSNRKVWWKCSKGHEWKISIANRVNGCGCPYCSNRKILQGYNDLITLNPSLAKEWNYDLNGDLKPEQFTANSGKKVWWKCSKGHEWNTTIASRNSGRGCPFCSGRRKS